MPSFNQVRGVEPSPVEYEEIDARLLEIRTIDGKVDSLVLEGDDDWKINNGQLVVRIDRLKEDLCFNYAHVVAISCKDTKVKKPKEKYKPENAV